MTVETDEFADVWGAPTTTAAVPSERYDQFGKVVPDLLLAFWREFGFAGFADGRLWLCDPVAWQPAVDLWTRDLDLPMGTDAWIAVCRTAFGRMQLWGRRTGMSLTITPYRGWILPTDQSDRMASPEDRDDQVYAALLAQDPESVDVADEDSRPLFDRVLAGQGPVGPDTVYGFVPALALGGPPRAENVEIFDAAVHLRLLSELTPRRIMRS